MIEPMELVGARVVKRAKYRTAAAMAGDPVGSYAGPAPRFTGDLVALLAIGAAERLALGWAAYEAASPGPLRAEEGLLEPDHEVAFVGDDGLRFLGAADGRSEFAGRVAARGPCATSA